ncbi:hypothetical protein ACQP2E_15155 [Actinoplanes sp. CA-015351]|uniref:hypothetical protein n=1 Tax=Actinoplanes sp. CA-015351 TaxID=3239897 RepID=UPI003D98E2F3
MTVQTTQAPAPVRRIATGLLGVSLAMILFVAGRNAWASLASGNHLLALAAAVAGIAPVLLAFLVTRSDH